MHRRSDYAYHLPPELIAQSPADRRDDARLLVVAGHLADQSFRDLPELLPDNAVLVVNDTRVLPARLHTVKDTGGNVELLFLEPADEPAETAAITGPRERWRCMAKSSKPLKPGMRLTIAGAVPPTPVLTVVTDRAGDSTVLVEAPGDTMELLHEHGEIPLPPYITRPEGPTAKDTERYQTVYAQNPGAVAAPTAGLHFTPDILGAVHGRGIAIAPVTLHVGMGTFAPMRVDDLSEHQMHTERYAISQDSAAIINEALHDGRPVVAVGTTCVRALESAALATAGQTLEEHPEPIPPRIRAGAATTNLFIRPGFEFRVVSHMVTNFHLPESTLLMLVAAFAGYGRIMNAYRHAVAARYRFFSFGDAMLLTRQSQ